MILTRVLVTEDELIPAFNLEQRLTKLGYLVLSIATSGAETLSMVEQQNPDIILMDIHIDGEIDGIETATRIPAELMIPVIYLTAYSEDATLKRAAATKPYGYLLKPFTERELHATIQMALQRRATEFALRQSESDLRQSRESFRYLFKNNPLPMWVFDVETLRFLEVNDAAIETYGFSHEEFLGMTVLDIGPADEVVKTKEYLASSTTDYMQAQNWRHRRKNAEEIQVDVFSHTLLFEGHRARISVAIDATQRNIAEEQLRQAQKMEVVGQLTGGVAHDFNNLLAVIQGNLELLEERLAKGRDVTEMVQQALAAAERGGILTHRLLAYSRQQPLEPRLLLLPDLVSNLMVMLRRTLGEAIDVEIIMAADLWPVRIDPHQLENALLNLSVNARDAMPDGGKLTIGGSNTVLDADYAAHNAEATPGNYVLVTVTDTGSGMSPESVGQAFEPFFTTKAVGKGTGLGLSMVFGFVRQSGGHIKINSEVGRGTTFMLYLPKAVPGSAAVVSTSESKATVSRANGETVMVVEDDAAVLRLAVALLNSFGYQTIDAPDGPSALQLLEHGPRIDLLMTDVVLPKGMNGLMLANAARLRQPTLKVLYMSGYTRDTIIHDGVLDEGVHLLMKPFHKAELAAKVRQALDADLPLT